MDNKSMQLREGACKYIWNVKSYSREAQSLWDFNVAFASMSNEEQLRVLDRAIESNKDYFDVEPLKDMRQERLDRDVMERTIDEMYGKDEEHIRELAKEYGRNGLDTDDLRRIGKAGLEMLQDAHKEIVVEDAKNVRRQNASKSFTKMKDVGKPLGKSNGRHI